MVAPWLNKRFPWVKCLVSTRSHHSNYLVVLSSPFKPDYWDLTNGVWEMYTSHIHYCFYSKYSRELQAKEILLTIYNALQFWYYIANTVDLPTYRPIWKDTKNPLWISVASSWLKMFSAWGKFSEWYLRLSVFVFPEYLSSNLANRKNTLWYYPTVTYMGSEKGTGWRDWGTMVTEFLWKYVYLF